MADYRIFAAVFILNIVVDGGQGTCSWTVCDESNNAVTLDLSSVYNHSFDAIGLGHVFSWSICTNGTSSAYLSLSLFRLIPNQIKCQK